MKICLITEQSKVRGLTECIRQSPYLLWACDCETTGLSPRQDRLRLLSLAYRADRAFVIDAFQVDIRPLLQVLQNKILVGHNLIFDLQFMGALGFCPGQVRDTMLMSNVRYAGRKTDDDKRLKHSLDLVALRELGITLPKGLQTSDWSGILSRQQIEYAGRDAATLLPIYERMRLKAVTFGLERAIDIEHRCLPALVWASTVGVPLDVPAWSALEESTRGKVCMLEQALDEAVEEAVGEPRVINWGSWQQVKKILWEVGCKVHSTRDSFLVDYDHPIVNLLREYRAVKKLNSSYGQNWLDLVENGRFYPHWLQSPTYTGRMAAAEPNMQNCPRDKAYRQCIAASNGKRFICADYAQIEVRIVAKLANETRMIEIFQAGGDIHTATAQLVLGKQEVTKADRQVAKSVVFGLLYGMGAPKFQMYAKVNYGVELTLEKASEIRNRFFKVYPKLVTWHRSHGNEEINTRTLIGRWRCGVTEFTEKNNAPSQGSGGDMIKLALALMWERRTDGGGYAPIAAIHDEILAEGPEETAEQAKEWVVRCMVDASSFMLWPCPTAVDATICASWGEKG